MANSLNNKVKEQYDHDNSGGSLNTNLEDFLVSESATGSSINTKWKNWAEGTGTSLNTRLRNKHGDSGSFNTRWKNWEAFNSRSFNFDGSNDYLAVGNINHDMQSGSNDTTVSLWVKFDDVTTTQSIWDQGNGSASGSNRHVLYVTSGKLRFYNYNVDLDAGSVSTGVWYNIIVTSTGSTKKAKVFVNGSTTGETSARGANFTGYTVLNVGRNSEPSEGGQHLNGLVDEFAVWNSVLSDANITKIASKVYDLSLASSYASDVSSNLIAWLRCGDKAEPESNASIARSDFYTSFDGSNDTVTFDCTGFPNLTPYTITAWFKSTDIDQAQAITLWGDASSYERRGMIIYNGGSGSDWTLVASINGENPQGATTLVENRIYHGAISVHPVNKTYKIYLNGQLDASGSFTNTFVAWSGDTGRIGSNISGSESFEGNIYSTAVYDAELSHSTIKQMAKSRFTKLSDFSTNLVSGWEMGSGSSDAHPTIQDVSSNNNDATMTNMATDDLVYSSILPDQSFIGAGANSPYNFIDLDGTGDYIDCGTGMASSLGDNYSGDFSVSLWYQVGNMSSVNDGLFTISTLSDTGRELNIALYQNTITWDLDNYKTTADITTINSWVHVVGTYKAGSASDTKLYINGSSVGSVSGSAFSSIDLDLNGKKTALATYFSTSFPLDGFLGQTVCWSSCLTSTQASEIYALGRHKNLITNYSSGLIGYWAMGALDAVTGLKDVHPTIYDRSGNANHGTIAGATADDLKSAPNAEPEGYKKSDTNRLTTKP